MTGRPVNIAEFRCRVMKARTAQFVLRDMSRSAGLRVVEPSGPVASPVVFDIGMARDAQRFRRRAARPISIQRRANVIRFGEPGFRKLAAVNAPPSWHASNGPYDLPPAA